MIPMTEYAKRRESLMRDIDADSILILPSAPEVLRNGDAEYPFRQNSDFYYLTGFDEPESVLVLIPNRKEGEYILFNRVRNRAQEIWTGPRAGQQGACKQYAAHQAFPIDEFKQRLPELVSDKKSIYYPIGMNAKFDKLLVKIVNQVKRKVRLGVETPTAFIDSSPLIHEMRVLKTSFEIAIMQKAVDITEQAHLRAMKACKPGMNECELEAEISYAFKRNGAQHPAYTPIVGAGKNTCVLHYIKNDQKIKNGDLVLIDAGAEYQNYAADITRTFPANGKFSAEQKAIYELVLKSQLAAIKSIKPGASWTKAQDIIVKIITKGLIDLGILKGRLDNLIKKQAYLPFYMHRSGHWLGLDVHDAGQYRINKNWRKLKPGMVLTVEPGIYISADIPNVAKRWQNIGVRIEDNVLVTKTGCKVLSQRIPKTVKEIEAVMKK